MGITEAVALYGAVVATFGVLWQARVWWLDRPHVSVRVAFGMGGPPAPEPMYLLTVSAVNKGRVPIRLEAAGLQLEAERTLALMNFSNWMARLPFDLAPGTNHAVYFDLREIVPMLVKDNEGKPPRSAWFRDATGRRHAAEIKPSLFVNWAGHAAS